MRPTASQIRAARAWLGWSQDQAAYFAGLHVSTVAKAEAGQAVQHDSIEALIGAFKAQGLVFSGRSLVHRLAAEERAF